MSAYFEYLRDVLVAFFRDFGMFMYKWIVSPWTDVGANFSNYNAILGAYSGGFGFIGWFFFVIFLLFFLGLLGAIGFGLFILIRKYIRFVKRELDKDEMRRQVERLNYELYNATQEKDKILNLKTAYMGLKPADEMAAEANEAAVSGDTRFP